MKYFLIAILVLISEKIICQIDTLYFPNDKVIIIDETYKKYIVDTTQFYLEERLIFKDGIKLNEFKYIDTSLNISVEKSWYPNRLKKRIIFFNRKTLTMVDEKWDEQGNLIETEYSFDNKVSTQTTYYQNRKVRTVQMLKFTELFFDNMSFSDNNSKVKWIEENTNDWYWLPTNMIEYYETGQLKSMGELTLKRFDIYDSEGNRIDKNRPCKKGEWIYFNEDGTIKEIVYYKNCIEQPK